MEEIEVSQPVPEQTGGEQPEEAPMQQMDQQPTEVTEEVEVSLAEQMPVKTVSDMDYSQYAFYPAGMQPLTNYKIACLNP